MEEEGKGKERKGNGEEERGGKKGKIWRALLPASTIS